MRTVLVTGGTRGIGRAIAEKFKESGDKVIITGTRTSPDNVDGFEYMSVDFGDAESTKKFFEDLEKIEIDVLINNAGINNIKLIPEVKEWEYDELFDVNLKAPYFMSQSAANSMKKRGGGHIINISSIMSVTSREKRSLYSTTKAGLTGMTRALSIELGPDNILVNCVSPGFTLTDLTRESLSQEEMDNFASRIPLGRLAEVEEMANVVCFMCSKENTYITGQNIVVDGGFTVV
jgi:3-oxoacyl-[acyl-carrier protein] reductase